MPVQAEALSSWLRHPRRKGARYLELSCEILVAGWPKVGEATGDGVSENLIGSAD
jgi:hypothetical protein